MIVLIALALQFQIPKERDVVLGGTKAYVMLAPEVVCGARVQELRWSPGGKHLAAVRVTDEVSPQSLMNAIDRGQRQVPISHSEIWVWSEQSRSSRMVARISRDEAEVRDMIPIGTSGHFVISIYPRATEFSGRQLWLLKSSGMERLLPNLDEELELPEVSPTHDIGALTFRNDPRLLRFFDSTGRIGPLLKLETPVYLQWKGALPITPVYERVGGKPKLKGWFSIDRNSGALSPTAEPQEDAREDLLQVAVVSGETALGGGQSVRTSAVAIGSNENKGPTSRNGLVSADGDSAFPAPGARAIAYVSQGIALVRRLVPLPREAFQRVETQHKAKQVGLSLLMYSADCDDEFPPSEQWDDRVKPYIRDFSYMRSFVYTFPGGKLPEGADRSKIELGYMLGPNGRAVVYADGRVQWEE